MSSSEVDWLERIRKLSADQVFVERNPPTPRYGRAQSKLAYLIREARLLGTRAVPRHPDRLEVAVWARPASGRGHGYYACFRLFFEEEAIIAALLFAFYDGTERSPGFKSFDAAAQFAAGHGFGVVG
jgi:hypothetical protein